MDTLHTILIRGRTIWDKTLMPAGEFAERLARIKPEMIANELDALLVYGDAYGYGNVCYASGYLPRLRDALAVIPKEGAPVLLVSAGSRDIPFAGSLTWVKDVRAAMNVSSTALKCISDLQLGRATLGLVSMEQQMGSSAYEALRKGLPDAKFVEATALIGNMRVTKSSREIKVMQEAARVAGETMAQAVELARPGISENELMAEIERFARLDGVEDIRFLVASGKASSQGLRPASQRVLASGDPLLLYIAVSYLRYWVDIGRTVSLGGQNALLETVTQAQRSMLQAVRPGNTVEQITERARTLLGDEGLLTTAEDYGLVNGIGLELCEKGFGTDHATATLAPGTTLSIRAGGHKAGEGGAFVSDVVVVTESGYQILTQ